MFYDYAKTSIGSICVKMINGFEMHLIRVNGITVVCKQLEDQAKFGLT